MKVRTLPVAMCVSVGILCGLGGATFNYAEGLSYLSEDPESCANCHIMHPQFDSWLKSSHQAVATCADCHLPDSFPEKYIVKAANGWSHSEGFTLQNFSEPIFIKPDNARVLHANCLRCHKDIMHTDMELHEGDLRCTKCHVTVGHGEPVGLGGPWKPEEQTHGRTDE